MEQRIPSPSLPNSLTNSKHGKPTLWISGGSNEIYLVNNSGRTIRHINASLGGFMSYDEGVISYSANSKYCYADVKDGDAVLVEKLDGYYDLDYIHQLHLELDVESLGRLEVITLPEKGQIKTQDILWEGNIPSEKITKISQSHGGI